MVPETWAPTLVTARASSAPEASTVSSMFPRSTIAVSGSAAAWGAAGYAKADWLRLSAVQAEFEPGDAIAAVHELDVGRGCFELFGGERHAFFHHLLASHKFGIATQQNICTAAGHVRGNCYLVEPSGLRHNLCFFFVELGVQHHVLHVFLLQQVRKPL